MANELNFFPDNKIDALTMLYLDHQDFSNLTPEELLDMYNDVRERIKNQNTKNRRRTT